MHPYRPSFHLRVSAGPWKSDDAKRLDDALVALNSTPIDLPWEDFELCEDGNHFTPQGAARFSKALCDALNSLSHLPPRLLVLADSTIGFYDFDDEGNYTGGASDALADMMVTEVRALQSVRVDSFCGSGFVSMAGDGQHFRARLLDRRRSVPKAMQEACLFVGGWNDINSYHSHKRIAAAVQACVSLAQSCEEPRNKFLK